MPIQTDLLPLATMPDQTANTDEQRIPDQAVQHFLSASLEPTKTNHIEGMGEIIPMISFAAIETNKDHEEFFDIETEKPIITLAEAEKLQHDAAVEPKDEVFAESELDLTIPIAIEHISEEIVKPINKKKAMISCNSIEKNEEQAINQKLNSEKSSTTMVVSESEKEKLPSIELFNENNLSDVSNTQVEQEFLRPKFSLRLKPTTTVNDGDNLKLEVHFIGQPEPKVY